MTSSSSNFADATVEHVKIGAHRTTFQFKWADTDVPCLLVYANDVLLTRITSRRIRDGVVLRNVWEGEVLFTGVYDLRSTIVNKATAHDAYLAVCEYTHWPSVKRQLVLSSNISPY